MGPECGHQSSNDRDVRNIEDGPPAQINEIDNVTESQHVQKISGGPTKRHTKTNQRSVALKPTGTVQNGRGYNSSSPKRNKSAFTHTPLRAIRVGYIPDA